MGKEKKPWKFFSWNTLCLVGVVCALNAIIWIAFHGVPLVGLPKAENVKSIMVTQNDSQQSEVTTPEDIELLVNATNLLNYRLWGKTEGNPIVTITYYLKDGNALTIEANRTSMWFNGKLHPLKETDMFIKIVQGLYFDLAQ